MNYQRMSTGAISARRNRLGKLVQIGRVKPWLPGVLLLAVGAACWWWLGRPAEPSAGTAPQPGASRPGAGGPRRFGGSNAPQPVSVQTARQQDIRVGVSAIGSIAASNTAIVRAQVSGVLQSLEFKEGQQVKAGQLLAQIDPRAFQASLSQAEGTLARDRALLDNARIDLARYRDLLAKDAISKQQLDTQTALVAQLEGTAKADQGVVDSARLLLSYTRVTAPIPGRVGLKQADLGNVVQPSDASGIVSITQTHPIALVFAVPATHVRLLTERLRTNQPLPVEAWNRGGTSRLAVGRVATIDNAIDVGTDTIKVKAIFPNADDALFPNQAVSVRLQLDLQQQVLAVPTSAVLRGAQGFYLYVVGADNTVSTRLVTPGAVDGDWTAVEGALKPGEKVVMDGVDRLRDGARVEVIAADPKQRAGANAPAASGRRGVRPGQGASGPAAPPPASAMRTAPETGPVASPAAPGRGEQGTGERPAWMDRVPPEVAEKLKAMSPDERRAWFQKRREEKEKGGASGTPN